MSAKHVVVSIVVAVLGVGAAVAIASCGGEDRGSVEIEGGTTGTTGTTGTGTTGTGTTGSGTTGSATSTAPVTVDTSATDPQALGAAMSKVASHARGQTAELVTATETLQQAVDAGDVARAKQAYAAARPYYESIEPLVALFPELDGKIDAREDDFPKKAADPTWTGFHPIERALWKDGEIDARTKRNAAGLVRDSKRLNELMMNAEVPPNVVIPGTAELIDEVEESKITGEEERYSKLDLPTFIANLEGGHEFYEALESMVEAKDPALHEQIEEAFDKAFAEVNGLKQGGRFPAYDELSAAQQRTIKQDIEALAEPLARVQGTLGVRS
jgi:iron uptake system component EfeO